MNIRVANKRSGEPGEYVGRPSPLGNPFRLKSAGGQYSRGETLELYEEWLRGKIAEKDPEVRAELNRLFRLALRQDELVLLCWCFPQACHSDVIARILLEKYAEIQERYAPIEEFQGEYRFLSNFYPCPIEFEVVPGRLRLRYGTSEHAYQAAKSLDPEWWKRVQQALTPAAVKKLGRQVELRPDWEDVKLEVMERILRIKFADDPLRTWLLETGRRELIEGNRWRDVYWGVCDGVGENHLGRLLMKIRAELRDA